MSHKVCKLSRGMKVEADLLVDDIPDGSEFDVIVLPGGIPGADHLAGSENLVKMLKEQKSKGKWYAAICASPAVVFKRKGIVSTETIVCYDHKSFTDIVGKMPTDRVVVSGKCITSVGPGSAIDFGLGIVECLVGKDKADKIAKEMMVESRIYPVFH